MINGHENEQERDMRALKSEPGIVNRFPVFWIRRTFLRNALMFALVFGTFGATFAQPASSPSAPVLFGRAADDWTVLTMAPDGSWGVATDEWISSAIARAVAACKKMSQAELGCGAAFKAVQAGWSLGIRCGEENIIVAEMTLGSAEQAAINRETYLRQSYVPHMPLCKRVVTVDPRGVIVDKTLGVSGQVDIHRR
jgi:hypothetical protein